MSKWVTVRMEDGALYISPQLVPLYNRLVELQRDEEDDVEAWVEALFDTLWELSPPEQSSGHGWGHT